MPRHSWRLSVIVGAQRPGVKLPAAGVQPVQRWLRELVAGFVRLPGDQGAVAAAGAADVDDGPVRLACHAVPGFGDAEERYPGIAAHLRACAHAVRTSR